jgi:uncharacterized Tic20 family protein
MSEQQTTLSAEERLLAALAHGSIIAQGLGLIIGILIYITQREKSRFVAFQALQAAAYQFITLLITIALWVIWIIVYAVSFIPIIQYPQLYEDSPPPFFWVALGLMIIPLALMVLFGLYGLWGALRTWQGRPFRYALLGRWLERNKLWGNHPSG